VTYDAAGRPLEQTNANGTVTTRSYVPQRGVLERLVTTSPAVAGPVQDLRYSYDDDLPLVTSVLGVAEGESWSYGYDDSYRLTSSSNLTNPAESQAFTYDSLGRIRSNSRVGVYDYPAGGQPRPHAPISVNGSPYSYHPNGNLHTGGGRSPGWDAENRLKTLGTATFDYDGFGERIKKVSPQGTSLYPFGDDYEITNGVITRYVSVEGLGVIAKCVGSGASLRTFWLHTDRLGSIQAITTDGIDQPPVGSLAFRRSYRPYGQTLAQAGSHTESRGWIDQRNDPETGLTYLHARYFDPTARDVPESGPDRGRRGDERLRVLRVAGIRSTKLG
jgi:YD repeat-containing protein